MQRITKFQRFYTTCNFYPTITGSIYTATPSYEFKMKTLANQKVINDWSFTYRNRLFARLTLQTLITVNNYQMCEK